MPELVEGDRRIAELLKAALEALVEGLRGERTHNISLYPIDQSFDIGRYAERPVPGLFFGGLLPHRCAVDINHNFRHCEQIPVDGLGLCEAANL